VVVVVVEFVVLAAEERIVRELLGWKLDLEGLSDLPCLSSPSLSRYKKLYVISIIVDVLEQQGGKEVTPTIKG